MTETLESLSAMLFFIGIAAYILGYLLLGIVKVLDKMIKSNEKAVKKYKMISEQQEIIELPCQELSMPEVEAEKPNQESLMPEVGINKLDLGSLKQQDKKIVLEEIIKDLDLIVMRLKSLVEEESHGKDHP
ncbi:hypothetical protein [uncultured Duncaniella sp.]|uniref:hypothetical protein n=1 Tax=uncultured Duncaniella sp. TaxID=2768039 RepID=UPI0025A9842C|nr:hypothetical protein [uncultured Duncaniella sp.]